MIDLRFIIIVGIVGLVAGEIIFLFLRYSTLKHQRCFEDELEKLTGQVEKGKLSKLLFQQMKQDIRRKYNVKFYEKWFGGK